MTTALLALAWWLTGSASALVIFAVQVRGYEQQLTWGDMKVALLLGLLGPVVTAVGLVMGTGLGICKVLDFLLSDERPLRKKDLRKCQD